MTALVAYGTSVASSTLSTASDLATTTGGTVGSKTTTLTGDSSTNYLEVLSQGGTGTDYASLPTPTGKGWLLDATTLEGNTIASGTWSGPVRLNVTTGTMTASLIVRFYKRSSGGAYTSIGSITLSSQSLTTTTTSYSFSASLGSMAFVTGDKLYIDFFVQPSGGSTWTGQGIKIILCTTATQGDASNFAFTTPGYAPSATTVTKTLQTRLRLVTQVNKTVQTRFLLRVQKTVTLPYRFVLQKASTTKTLVFRFLERVTATKTLTYRTRLSVLRTFTLPVRLVMKRVAKVLQFRFRLAGLRTLTLPSRLLLRVQRTTTLQFRLNLTGPRILSGGFVLFANGTGTVAFDHFRVTQFPDPALSLAPIIPRAGSTGAAWNALTPTHTTLTIKTSLDGVNWTDVTGSNGGNIPGVFSQPSAFVDTFALNSSSNYTSTFRTGGAAGTWTYNTANSRVIATGGTNALYLYNNVNRADIDFFADLDQSDAGGLVWRYIDQNNFYYLVINDTLSSTSTLNTVTLYKVASNVQTQLGTATITYTVGTSTSSYTVYFTRGTYRRFRVTMLAGVITVLVDGNVLLTYTDPSPLSAGQVGLYNNGGTVGSRYYQLWIISVGDYVTGNPSGDIVTGDFVYTQATLSTTDPTVTPQVEDLTTYAFTPQINPGVSIPSVTYNSTFISKNFDDLAKQCNFSWYFDPNKTFIFGGVNALFAPWILQSAPYGLVSTVDLEVDTNLELDVENDLYRNRQTILGALATIVASSTFTGDGTTRTFTLGYPLAATPTILLNGVAQTVGLKGTTGSAYYYAINDAVIEQDASQVVLQDTDQLSVPFYAGLYVVNVTVDDTTEQAARAAIEGGSGIVEDVQDYTSKNITQAAAVVLAQQLIARYANAGRTLVFDTSRNGLAVGQMLTIHLPEEGINDGQFLILQVEISLKKHVGDTNIYWYKVTCSELPKKASLAKLIASGLDFTQGVSGYGAV